MNRTWREHRFVLSVFIPACIVGVSVAVVMYVLQDLEKLETIPVVHAMPEFIRRGNVECGGDCGEVKGAISITPIDHRETRER